jgi:hypothetical protein
MSTRRALATLSLGTALAASSWLAALPVRAQEPAKPPAAAAAPGGAVCWRDLMTPEERTAHRAKMQGLKTPEERAAYKEEHRKQMMARAKERGVTLKTEGCGGGMGPGPHGG